MKCSTVFYANKLHCMKTSMDADRSTAPLAVFLDLSKAFDTIDHQNRLSKLDHFGVRGIALDWFRNYLYNK